MAGWDRLTERGGRMDGIKIFLEYGATGMVALMIVAVLVPAVRAFIGEMRAGRDERRAERQERAAMRKEHYEFVSNHARHTADVIAEQTEAMLKVREGLDRVCDRLGNGDLKG